jgi:hypothetical protein
LPCFALPAAARSTPPYRPSTAHPNIAPFDVDEDSAAPHRARHLQPPFRPSRLNVGGPPGLHRACCQLDHLLRSASLLAQRVRASANEVSLVVLSSLRELASVRRRNFKRHLLRGYAPPKKIGVISQEVLQAFERRQVKNTIERSADAIAFARKTSKVHDAEAAGNPLLTLHLSIEVDFRHSSQHTLPATTTALLAMQRARSPGPT